MTHYDTIIIGAGAAGLMCAIEAGRRGRRVLLLDHADKPGKKIRISGGGRCNFTNLHTTPDAYLSDNPRFCVSALKRYTPADFIAKVDAHGIAWHEKTLGQLFCDGSAQQIVDMLTRECREAGAELRLSTTIDFVEKAGAGFRLSTPGGRLEAASLVIATGGKSIPKMGATDFAYRLAAQFGVPLVPTRPALVPLTFGPDILSQTAPLSGLSTEAAIACGSARFREALLFTHRGLSGPAILQISSYWREGDEIEINLTPDADLAAALRDAARANGKQAPQTALAAHLPKRLAQFVAARAGLAPSARLAELSSAALNTLAEAATRWRVTPMGTEGYRTAEATSGGIDTAALSSRTMECTALPGLYFIGEAVDVTGWLGGYNFQWAWASGWAAGQAA